MDGRRSRDSKVIEELGSFNPLDSNLESALHLKRDRIEYWLGVGAQPTDTVRVLLKKSGMMSGALASAK